MVAGICGGLGEYFDFDPVIIRLIFVVTVLAGGAGILAYIVLWIVVPEADKSSYAEQVKASINEEDKDSIKNAAKKAAEEVKVAAHEFKSTVKHRRRDGGSLGAAVLIILGILLLIGNFAPVFRFAKLWPLLLVIVGLTILISSTLDKE